METITIRERTPKTEPVSAPTPSTDEPEEITREQSSKLRIITNNLHRLNESIAEAVSAGLTVEIKRASRFHGGTGHWGDQIYLVVNKDA